MEVDEIAPDEGAGRPHICLKHSRSWRCKYEHLLNMLREKPLHDGVIYRIGKVVCTCDPGKRCGIDPQTWQTMSENDYRAAQEHFERFIDSKNHCSDEYSNLLNHFKQMRESNLLGEGDNSAKRFIYLFYRIDKFKDISLLGPVKTVENQGPPKVEFELPLTQLKEEYFGVFIGKKGNTLKKLLKPFRNSKVTVKKDGDTLKANIFCREKDKNEIVQKIFHHEDEIVALRKAHESRVILYNLGNQEMETEDSSSGSEM